MDEQRAGARRALALPREAALPGARYRRLGAGQGPPGSQLAPARRGDQDRRHRSHQRPRLAPLFRRNPERKPDRRRAQRLRRQPEKGGAVERNANQPVKPKQLLSLWDGIVLICGMVIGAGIFRAPSVVAGNVSSNWEFIAAWVLGGVVSLCGALVYAELAARHPDTGGEYAFLSRGRGRGVAFVFAWARMTVIQPGAIAAVAFVFGDYASEMLRLGEKSSAIYAAIGVAALTVLNVVGTRESKTLQTIMQMLLFAGLLFIAVAGFLAGAPPKPAAAAASSGTFGLAMIFVLLTYGGWNEAAYLSGEVRDARRNMIRILIGGILAVTVIYLVVNLGYLAALGLAGMRESKAVAA